MLILFGMFSTVLLRTNRESWLFSLYGYIAMAGYFSASMPQILINRRLRSTASVDLSFVLLLAGGLCCDIVSAYSLNWGRKTRSGPLLRCCSSSCCSGSSGYIDIEPPAELPTLIAEADGIMAECDRDK